MTETVDVKVDESRAMFEAWVREEFPVWGKYLLWSESLDAYGYSTTNLMYRSWKASRAALVVELPATQHINEADINIPDEADWPDGFNTALEQCSDALRAAGITVKGDSDDFR